MTRNCFDDIMRFLHVADNENLPTGDKFGKVRPLFSALNAKFLAAFPQQHHQLAINESMVPYYGRHSAKQFIFNSVVTLASNCHGIAPYSDCTALVRGREETSRISDATPHKTVQHQHGWRRSHVPKHWQTSNLGPHTKVVVAIVCVSS